MKIRSILMMLLCLSGGSAGAETVRLKFLPDCPAIQVTKKKAEVLDNISRKVNRMEIRSEMEVKSKKGAPVKYYPLDFSYQLKKVASDFPADSEHAFMVGKGLLDQPLLFTYDQGLFPRMKDPFVCAMIDQCGLDKSLEDLLRYQFAFGSRSLAQGKKYPLLDPDFGKVIGEFCVEEVTKDLVTIKFKEKSDCDQPGFKTTRKGTAIFSRKNALEHEIRIEGKKSFLGAIDWTYEQVTVSKVKTL